MLMLFTGFLAGWGLAILLDPRARNAHKGTSNPPLCRHCGCAHPLGEQNPASDPGLRM
jgi:hypothetical protein